VGVAAQLFEAGLGWDGSAEVLWVCACYFLCWVVVFSCGEEGGFHSMRMTTGVLSDRSSEDMTPCRL
jgi:hypothetical protein